MKNDLAYYRGLPYNLEIRRFTDEEDDQIYYCASYKQLPTVKGVDRDRLLAIRLAKELFDSYIEAQLEWGEAIPEPDSRRFREAGGLFKFKGTVSDPPEMLDPPKVDVTKGPLEIDVERMTAGDPRAHDTELALTG